MRLIVALSALGMASLAILVSFAVIVLFADTQSASASLELVTVLMRHGDRTPTDNYPNDPYKNYAWPDGIGALTNIGKQQLYDVGGTLRTIYGPFLTQRYSPDDVFVQSSDADRCHMSVAALLAALYPPTDHQVWNTKLLWQPIPIHSVPSKLDMTLAMKKPCVKFDQELASAYNSSEIQQTNKENADLYAYVSKNAGKTYSTITDIEFLYTTLEIEQNYGLVLPNWTLPVFPDRMLPLMKQSLAIFSYSPFMKRIRGGAFLKEILNQMISKRDGNLKPDRKLFLYSAHDITLVHVFRTLGFTELMKPEYGATIIFELHTIPASTDLQVQLKYLNNTVMTSPSKLSIPNCTEPCTLDNFTKILVPMIPGDWEQECHNA